LRHQLDRTWIRMLHAPYQLDRESFSACSGRGKIGSVIVRNSSKNHFSPRKNSGKCIVNASFTKPMQIRTTDPNCFDVHQCFTRTTIGQGPIVHSQIARSMESKGLHGMSSPFAVYERSITL